MEKKDTNQKQIGTVLEDMHLQIKPDPNSYEMILTQKEKDQAIEHARLQLAAHNSWKVNEYKKLITTQRADHLTDPMRIQVDEDAVIAHANMLKHWQIERQQQRMESEKLEKSIQQQRTNYLSQFDAKFFYRLMRYNVSLTGKELILNKHTTPYITMLCFFMGEDPRFETELGYDLKKGLWIRGACGLGKTFCVQHIADNPRSPICVTNIINIQNEVKKYGNYVPPKNFVKLMIDDLGTETDPEIVYYGTRINWGKEYLETFYHHAQDQFNRLIVVTNESFDQIEEKYGYRVRSRIRDMFNVIDVTGDDMRGKKLPIKKKSAK